MSETIVQTVASLLMSLCVLIGLGSIIIITATEIYSLARAQIRRKRGR